MKTAGRDTDEGNLLVLAVLASVIGLGAGLIGGLFRLSLQWADTERNALIAWAHGQSGLGFAVVVGAAATATCIAAFLVRRLVPTAAGSGIPHIEGVLKGELTPAPLLLVPVKFVGGVLAIGSGLALGREGPSVQMAVSLAHWVGQTFRRTQADCRVLMAGAGGAGLATAFSAPLAGAIFVLEELVGRFDPRIAVVALGASASAISVARLLLGDATDFVLPNVTAGGIVVKPFYILLGLFTGGLAIFYNRSLLASVAAVDRLGWEPETRGFVIGAGVGVLAWFAPDLVGGGDPITQRTLNGAEVIVMLPLLFLVRLALGAASYSAGTPGGLLAPVLVLGAQAGLFFGLACRLLFPDIAIDPEAFAAVAMAAFFAGVVRAPVTGIALVTEMTGSTALLLPMVAASFTAMVVPTLVGNPPVYDSLGRRASRLNRSPTTTTSRSAPD